MSELRVKMRAVLFRVILAENVDRCRKVVNDATVDCACCPVAIWLVELEAHAVDLIDLHNPQEILHIKAE